MSLCGAVWREQTLFDRYVHVCQREPHTDGTHHDGWRAWAARAGEERMSVYSCNAIKKEKTSTWFCSLPLHHPGDHADGERTWKQERFGDEDDAGTIPIW